MERWLSSEEDWLPFQEPRQVPRYSLEGSTKAREAEPYSHTSPGKVYNMTWEWVSRTCRSPWYQLLPKRSSVENEKCLGV